MNTLKNQFTLKFFRTAVVLNLFLLGTIAFQFSSCVAKEDYSSTPQTTTQNVAVSDRANGSKQSTLNSSNVSLRGGSGNSSTAATAPDCSGLGMLGYTRILPQPVSYPSNYLVSGTGQAEYKMTFTNIPGVDYYVVEAFDDASGATLATFNNVLSSAYLPTNSTITCILLRPITFRTIKWRVTVHYTCTFGSGQAIGDVDCNVICFSELRLKLTGGGITAIVCDRVSGTVPQTGVLCDGAIGVSFAKFKGYAPLFKIKIPINYYFNSQTALAAETYPSRADNFISKLNSLPATITTVPFNILRVSGFDANAPLPAGSTFCSANPANYTFEAIPQNQLQLSSITYTPNYNVHSNCNYVSLCSKLDYTLSNFYGSSYGAGSNSAEYRILFINYQNQTQ